MSRLPDDALIEAQALGVRFAGRQVLRDVALTIHPGEIVTLVGPNGSGKTTLVRALIGAVRPTAGEVIRKRGLRMGYAPQKLTVDRTMPLTVRRFLGVGGVRLGDVVERTGIASVLDSAVNGLSGGELQRVLLARALIRDPHLLILDEPTQGLDQPGEAGFYRMIETLRAETGCAVLMVSHDLHVVMSASDRVICLNGHVCCEGTPERVGEMPEYRALFGHGTQGALALYRHEHDHHHHHDHGEVHE